MDLNYHHLRYFHVVAEQGSVQRSARLLHVAPSTVSTQIKTLERDLGRPLFVRSGRNLVLTPFGEQVKRHADAIFEAGGELVRMLETGGRHVVHVGVSSVLPKLLVRDLLAPSLTPHVQLMVEEGATEALLGELASRRLDVVLTDSGMPSWIAVRAHSHLVIETDTSIFGCPSVARPGDIRSASDLGELPWLVPPTTTHLRRSLEEWWDEVGIRPDIAAVIDDSALIKAMASAGLGVFAAPTRMTAEIQSSYCVSVLWRAEKVLERAFAITREEHPGDTAVRAICGLDHPLNRETG